MIIFRPLTFSRSDGSEIDNSSDGNFCKLRPQLAESVLMVDFLSKTQMCDTFIIYYQKRNKVNAGKPFLQRHKLFTPSDKLASS